MLIEDGLVVGGLLVKAGWRWLLRLQLKPHILCLGRYVGSRLLMLRLLLRILRRNQILIVVARFAVEKVWTVAIVRHLAQVV